MAVRNFWIEADIDGRKTELKGGPANKQGGLSCTIYQRDEGRIEVAFKIKCWEANGGLFTGIYDREGNIIGDFITER